MLLSETNKNYKAMFNKFSSFLRQVRYVVTQVVQILQKVYEVLVTVEQQMDSVQSTFRR